MNYTETIREVMERTAVSEAVCQQVINAYEEYCEHNVTRTSRKHLEAITAYIAGATSIEEKTCELIMRSFFDVLKEQLKSKIPFVR